MTSSPLDDTRSRCAVLVGAVGAGKSSVGNALCQKPAEPPPFRSRRSASGVTTACACAPCLPPGLGGAVVSSASERWWVVDTPGLCDGDDARAPEPLLRAIEACAAPLGAASVNPTGGVDVFLLVFNATGRVSSGDLEAIETLKQRFGAARFLERAVAVFTHADVLRADGADDVADENLASSYLRDAPPALASLLRAAGGGEPVFADVRARSSESSDLTEGAEKANARVRFLDALAASVRRVDEVAARSPLRSASGDPTETRIVAADVAAAAAARRPRLGMKAARRRRQEARKRNQNRNETVAGRSNWLGDALAWVSNVVAPPPPSRPPNERPGDTRGPAASDAPPEKETVSKEPEDAFFRD